MPYKNISVLTRSLKFVTFSAVLAITANSYSYCVDSPKDNEAYKIINSGSALLLNVSGGSSSNGANVDTASNNGNNSQRFYLRYNSSSYYWGIEAAHTGMPIDVANASMSNGGNVIQANASDEASQEWELKQQSDGSYKIVNRNSSHSLTVAGSTEGANVYQNADASLSSQRWWLEPVTYTCGSGSDSGNDNTSSDTITLSGNASDSKVDLTWNTPSVELNALQIYYDTDSDPSGRARLASLSTSTTRYTASNLTNGTSYWFWVKYLTTDNVWHNSNAFKATPSANASSGFTLTGFASQSGSDGLSKTTGGAGGSTVTVTSCSDLSSALSSSDTLTIQIPDNKTIDCKTSGKTVSTCKIPCPDYQDAGKYTYRIPTSNLSCSDLGAESTSTQYRYDKSITVKSNKTLVGLGSGSAIEGATLKLSGVKNIIIRNLAIKNINPHLIEAGDGITVNSSSHIAIDHVDFSMISDGHVDIADSENLTLSYNHFDGYNPYVCANQHWYTSLVDNSEATLNHNFWDYAAGRNPKLIGSKTRAHLYNNYWKDITYFSIGADDNAEALVEGNYFNNAARPHWNIGTGKIDGNVNSNVYTGQSASGKYAIQDTGDNVFNDVNLYNYSLDNDVYSLPNLDGLTGPQ